MSRNSTGDIGDIPRGGAHDDQPTATESASWSIPIYPDISFSLPISALGVMVRIEPLNKASAARNRLIHPSTIKITASLSRFHQRLVTPENSSQISSSPQLFLPKTRGNSQGSSAESQYSRASTTPQSQSPIRKSVEVDDMSESSSSDRDWSPDFDGFPGYPLKHSQDSHRSSRESTVSWSESSTQESDEDDQMSAVTSRGRDQHATFDDLPDYPSSETEGRTNRTATRARSRSPVREAGDDNANVTSSRWRNRSPIRARFSGYQRCTNRRQSTPFISYEANGGSQELWERQQDYPHGDFDSFSPGYFSPSLHSRTSSLSSNSSPATNQASPIYANSSSVTPSNSRTVSALKARQSQLNSAIDKLQNKLTKWQTHVGTLQKACSIKIVGQKARIAEMGDRISTLQGWINIGLASEYTVSEHEGLEAEREFEIFKLRILEDPSQHKHERDMTKRGEDARDELEKLREEFRMVCGERTARERLEREHNAVRQEDGFLE